MKYIITYIFLIISISGIAQFHGGNGFGNTFSCNTMFFLGGEGKGDIVSCTGCSMFNGNIGSGDTYSCNSFQSLTRGGKGSGDVCNCLGNQVLPIELLFFKAEMLGEKVLLKWATLSEIDNDYFTIERTQNLVLDKWKVISNISGAGNSNMLLNYNTIDHNPLTGISYYRLKQTDINGGFSYSEIISIVFNPTSEFIIYPNPTSTKLHVQYPKKDNNIILINILDITGKKILKLETNKDETIIDVSGFPKGMYFLKTEFYVSRFIVE